MNTQLIIKRLITILLTCFVFANSAIAARDNDSYDGNIYPIYAGNGSLVPPQTTLKNSLKNKRTSVLVFYLDDSSTSKSFAPVVSGIKLLWSNSIDLIPLTTDELQNDSDDLSSLDEAYYWRGNIPQLVVIDADGNVLLDEEGQVPIEKINSAISKATGLKEPDFTISIKSFNEYNSEPSKDGYTDSRSSRNLK